MELLLCPQPKTVTLTEGHYAPDRFGYISLDDRAVYSAVRLATAEYFGDLPVTVGEYAHRAPAIAVKQRADLPAEGYRLTVSATGVTVEYSQPAGAFYGFMTLNQLYRASRELPCLVIEDEPDFPLRGYMWDVARNKIPKLETIFEMIDRLASLKINHLELYMEGAPFAYPSFPEMWQNRDVFTGDELMRIDAYCRERFIDFVPNQNTFGHMAAWLAQLPPEMAIAPNGFYYAPWDMHSPVPHSLNPFHEDSIKLVRRMSDDLLPHFSSNLYNVCCDEVLELGCGITEGMTHEELGITYYDFLMKIYAYCKEKGKTMLYWGDIIEQHPELLERLPKDAVALNWGYEPYEPSEESCAAFEQAGIPYCVCPGTATWGSFVGKTAQMYGNIRGAVEKGRRHGAMGVLLTEWGDLGHLHGWAAVLPGIVYGAALSWSVDSNREIDLAAVLDQHVLRDPDRKAGRFLLEVGEWYSLEELPLKNQTVTVQKLFLSPLTQSELREVPCLWENMDHRRIDRIEAFLSTCEERLAALRMPGVPDEGTVLQEYAVGLQALKLGLLCGRYKLYFHEGDREGQKRMLQEIVRCIPPIIHGYQTTWTVKNRYSGLADSLGIFEGKRQEAMKLLQKLTAEETA